MSKERWVSTHEKLEEQFGREPTEVEIENWIAAEDDHAYEQVKENQ